MDFDDITDFLPKYPNIDSSTSSEDELFEIFNGGFNENIYKKKEFYDEKLSETEQVPIRPGIPMKHQKIISRFFSSYTSYDQLLLLHEMGSGKTCSAVSAIEKIKGENNGFTGAMIFAKGDGVLDNFKNELVFKCTDGRYIPENYNSLTELEKTRRIKKKIEDFYNFHTFEIFAKYLSKISDEEIGRQYQNKIIVVDEVHNLRIQDKESGISMYEQFHRFLHNAKNCKVLIMSGTPMKDDPEEIASVMNLILPVSEQLPIKEEFINEFFTQRGDMLYIKEEKKNELKKKFKGRVSYLKAMQSEIKKVFAGKNEGELKQFNVVEDIMSEFQTRYYNEAYQRDSSGEKGGIYSYSRQASLFVFPDGTYGKEGFDQDRYIKKTEKKSKKGEKTKIFNYSAGQDLKNEIVAETEDEMLEKLSKFSSKYAVTIRSILNAEREGKAGFVYCEFVRGSGAILLTCLLELFGFGKAYGREEKNSFKKRYAIITKRTATQKDIKLIISRFNQPDNMNGKIINIIIGSKVISEGFSLKNIQEENILTPHWNYSETAQAIARGWRLGSHKDLINSGVIPFLKVYQRVSIPSDNSPSIDLHMYEVSETKDINIKHIERLMKEMAFDCALNYKRNLVVGSDNERECEYMSCNYVCDGVEVEDLDNEQLDYSTFQLYYDSGNMEEIRSDILDLFRLTFQVNLFDLVIFFQERFNMFEIISTLHKMINESTLVINKYGFRSYIKEENNVYFLISSLSEKGNYMSKYYTENPNVKVGTNFTDILNNIYINFIPSVINNIFKVTSNADLQKLIVKIPIKVREILIENCLLAKRNNINVNVDARELVLEYFKNYYFRYTDNGRDTWVSNLEYEENNVLRCLDNLDPDARWTNCSEDYIKILEDLKLEQKSKFEEYPYYGLHNTDNNVFCIREVGDKNKEDKRKKTTGRVCTTWNKDDLAKLVIDIMKIEPPRDQIFPENLDRMWGDIQKTELGRKIYTDDRKNSLTRGDLQRALYWTKGIKKEGYCEALKNWFEENKLLSEDKNCGSRKVGKNKK